ncbi:MAG: bifunctional DNA primase/polymerase, partial [Desulfurellales bacterium]
MTFQEEVHAAAKDYVQRGWFVFPLHTILEDGECSCGKAGCGDAGKHPRVARGLKEASRDLAKIDEWFGKDAPPANIGLVTGEISGITVIDVDIGDGKFGAESWAEAIKDHGEPQTLMAQTGSGGLHVVFQYNSALKTASNVLGKGVDCRNDGGYIVAAPSRHRSGGVYSWINLGDPIA